MVFYDLGHLTYFPSYLFGILYFKLSWKLILFLTDFIIYLRYLVVYNTGRLISVYFPVSVYTPISKIRKTLSIIALAPLSLLIYSFSIESTNLVQTENEESRCLKKLNDNIIYASFSLFDAFVTFLIPSIIVTTANILISVKLLKNRFSLRSQQSTTEIHQINHSLLRVPSNFSCHDNQTPITILSNNEWAIAKRKSNYSKASFSLLLISTIFITLNMQNAFIKIKYYSNNL